jgi:hypothetical protein
MSMEYEIVMDVSVRRNYPDNRLKAEIKAYIYNKNEDGSRGFMVDCTVSTVKEPNWFAADKAFEKKLKKRVTKLIKRLSRQIKELKRHEEVANTFKEIVQRMAGQ